MADSTWKTAKKSEVHAGSYLIPDSGFDCLSAGEIHTVFSDDESRLYIHCTEGQHFLDGQLNEDDEYVGLSLSH